MQPADLNQQPHNMPAAGLHGKPDSNAQPLADGALHRPSNGVAAKLRGEVGFGCHHACKSGQHDQANTSLRSADCML